MNTTVINKGDTVYNLQGDAAEAVTPFERGWMVRPMYETFHGDEEDYELGPPEFWKEVFTVVPIQKKCDEIAKLDETIAAKKNEIHLLSKNRYEITKTEKEEKARLESLAKRSAALTRLEDFLDGKITHYVKSESYEWNDMNGRSYFLTESAEEWSDDDPKSRELKLLTLFGNTKGNLEFRLNQYGQGGRSHWKLCWPFCSKEEADAFVRERITSQLEDWLIDPKDRSRLRSCIIENLKRFGMEVPQAMEEAEKNAVIENKRYHADIAKKVYEKAMAEVAKAEGASL